MREVDRCSALEHPRVARILEAWMEGRDLVVVSEYVEGSSLAVVLREQRRIAVPLACRIAHQLVEGLAALAAAGVVHRDVRPGTLMLGANASLKIVDLGLGKRVGSALADAEVSMAQEREILGIEHHIAPPVAGSSKALAGRTS